jgi:hypothetical protein
MKFPIGQAMKMKRAGYRACTPDILIFKARGGYFGLFIEMKREKGGVVSTDQKEIIALLLSEGYSCHVCKGFDEARKVIDRYMQFGLTKRGVLASDNRLDLTIPCVCGKGFEVVCGDLKIHCTECDRVQDLFRTGSVCEFPTSLLKSPQFPAAAKIFSVKTNCEPKP